MTAMEHGPSMDRAVRHGTRQVRGLSLSVHSCAYMILSIETRETQSAVRWMVQRFALRYGVRGSRSRC